MSWFIISLVIIAIFLIIYGLSSDDFPAIAASIIIFIALIIRFVYWLFFIFDFKGKVLIPIYEYALVSMDYLEATLKVIIVIGLCIYIIYQFYKHLK